LPSPQRSSPTRSFLARVLQGSQWQLYHLPCQIQFKLPTSHRFPPSFALARRCADLPCSMHSLHQPRPISGISPVPLATPRGFRQEGRPWRAQSDHESISSRLRPHLPRQGRGAYPDRVARDKRDDARERSRKVSSPSPSPCTRLVQISSGSATSGPYLFLI
jgi:hypothetical protein